MKRDGLRVIVVGGGVAGLEALLALRATAADAVRLHLLSPGDYFVYRPLEVLEPFNPRAMVRIPWARILHDRRISHLSTSLREVDIAAHQVMTSSGQRLGYDILVLAPGARLRHAIAGAVTVGAPDASVRLADMLRKLRSSASSQVTFVVPPGVTWSLPIYELTVLTARFAREAGVAPELTVATAEAQPLEVFGTAASEMVRSILDEWSIRLHTRGVVVRRAAERASLALADGLPADEIVAMPQLEGPRIAGLRADDDGFLVVDEHGRVGGQDDIYAAGDVISFPIKQGGLAAQQADAVAAHIASRAGVDADPAPFEPVLRGMLLTDTTPRYLRRALRAGAPDAELSGESPWQPAVKIVGRHLAPYLAIHGAWAHGTGT